MRTFDILHILIIPAALGGWLTVDEMRRARQVLVPPPFTLQMAWSRERAEAILRAWTPLQRQSAARAIHWDFGFIPSYALFLAGLVALPWPMPLFLTWAPGLLVFAPLAAGLFDVIENLGMLRMVQQGHAGALGPRIVTACAVLKFALVGATILALVYFFGFAVFLRL